MTINDIQFLCNPVLKKLTMTNALVDAYIINSYVHRTFVLQEHKKIALDYILEKVKGI